MPFTLTGFCEYREEIRKSRFITLAAPITSPADAVAFIEQHSDLNATHNCWAWKLGDQYRSNDDRSEEHKSELQSPMRISYAVFRSKQKRQDKPQQQARQ